LQHVDLKNVEYIVADVVKSIINKIGEEVVYMGIAAIKVINAGRKGRKRI